MFWAARLRESGMGEYIKPNSIIHGDSREILRQIAPDSVACSIWSPPYHVGKEYEAGMSYEDWLGLLQTVVSLHTPIIYIFWKPGITVVDRDRLTKEEWVNWGSRAVWSFPSVRANDDHEAKFPLELPRRIIRLLTTPEDVVLDCFVGSGTTAVAAILEGRQYIGIDIEEKYVEMSRKACRRTLESMNGEQQLQLF
jgi:DNA modification methylase